MSEELAERYRQWVDDDDVGLETLEIITQDCLEHIKQLEAENKPYREALQEIADNESILGWGPAARIALKALETTGEDSVCK